LFLTSGPDLVVATCTSGLIGTFPALNQRTSEGYAAWLDEVERRLAGYRELHAESSQPAPFGVNIIAHRSNARLAADLEITVAHKVPLVITSLGAVAELVDAVHSYGGLVFHDVINQRHAEKAAKAGVDGIIAICAGAGGHAGTLSPFALVPDIRRMFKGTIILGGVMSTGAHVAAARLLGADLAYLGTRFIATRESIAPEPHKQMIVDSTSEDIVYTPAISGVAGNFLRPSITASGLDPDNLTPPDELNFGVREVKAWKAVWSAGQGVGSISDIPAASDLCARLIAEYRAAVTGLAQTL